MARTDDDQQPDTQPTDPGWLSPAQIAEAGATGPLPEIPAEAYPANSVPLPVQYADDPDAEPEHPAYCHRGDCDVDQVMLWRPVTERPAMCQCGQLLNAERLDQPEQDSEQA